ncbi:MAG: hypothetical protein Q8Q59_13625 [Luteolibacter sp.]|jgi:hypothetical protein|nr:hypothetical protein [Luteolibacter sp.]
MPAPSDPEKYSIDEMVDRLKNRQAQDPDHEGELVTRSDGTQAIRVRKRKRRSHQPQKEEFKKNRRARMIQVSGALILLLMAVFAAGSAIAYANSAPFRQKIIGHIAASSGARVELEQFRMNPTRAIAGRLLLTWPDGNALREFTARSAGAAISPSSFIGKSLTGEEATCTDGILTLGVPQAGQPTRATPTGPGPLSVRFKRYAIPKLLVRIGDPAAPLVSLHDSEASFQTANASGRAQLLLNRGNIRISGWPNIQMDRAHLEFRGKEMDVVGMRLLHDGDNRGVFELMGTVSPYAADRPSTLAVRMESFLLSGIAGPDLGRLISGRIDTLSTVKSNYVSFTPGFVPAAKLDISFRNSLSSGFEVQGFPFLSNLARLMDNDAWFERPVFDTDATAMLRRADSAVVIEEINFEHKGRMALRGNLMLSPDHRLSGTLDVGIAEAMVKAAPNRRLDAMAGPLKEGFRWISLQIGGTAAAPTDNFLEILDATKLGVKPAPASKIPTFEDLTTPE